MRRITFKQLLNHQFVNHLFFWIGVLAYFVFSSSMHFYTGYIQVIELNLMLVFLQMGVAYLIIYLLIPKLLDKQKIIQFIFWILVSQVILFSLYNIFMIHYYDPKYYESYSDLSKRFAKENFIERTSKFSVFLSKVIKFLTPTALLLLAKYYQDQRRMLKINEQKRTAELAALKNQLNPHFLFNTLNNLYSLAIEKSDKTPEVIERLSDILDYMLHRCNEQFVPLKSEIALIENYLALEKIRYGARADLDFRNFVTSEVNIAPLLLLALIENAFKHGVRPALKAKVEISITEKKQYLEFKVNNSKPTIPSDTLKPESAKLGLNNVRQQLAMLYPEEHELIIKNKIDFFEVLLILKKK